MNEELIKVVKSKELFNTLMERLSILDKNHEIITVDITDIYESAIEYICLINNINSEATSYDDLVEKLVLLESELDHINWHYKSLCKNIKNLK